MKLRRKTKFIAIVTAMIMAVAGYSVAADTLTDSIKNGKISGEAKIWYQTNDSDVNKHIFSSENSWFDAGLRLGYDTDTYKGFGAGVNFFVIDDLNAYENWANRSMMGSPHDETWTWLGEAYISYQRDNTLAKLGRQNINSPLVNSDTWAIFPNNFEAILVKNSDIPDTTLIGGYIWQERWRGSEDFEDFHDDLLMLAATNKSIPDTTIAAHFYRADDDYNTNYIPTQPITDSNNPSMDGDKTLALYLEAKTKIAAFNFGAQYIRIDPDVEDAAGDRASETDAFAAKIATTLGMVDLEFAYSWVGDGYYEAAKLSDNRCKTPLYTRTISGDGDIAGRPKTKSAFLSAAIAPIDNLNVTARYGYYSFNGSNDYRKVDERHISDGDGSSAELITKYTGIKDITLWGSLWYSNHEGCGVFNGLNDENMITFRCWARFMF